MSSKSFESGDLVWAKMKGYPPWPGKIMVPPPDAKTKPKKCHHYVFFFGSDNYAWIPDDSIELHSEKLIEKYGKKKGGAFQTAVETIIESSKSISKYHKSKGSSDKHFNEDPSEDGEHEKQIDKFVDSDGKSKISASASKRKKLSNKKEFSVNTVSEEKKPVKKRKYSPDQNQIDRASTSFRSEDASTETSENSLFTMQDLDFYSNLCKDSAGSMYPIPKTEFDVKFNPDGDRKYKSPSPKPVERKENERKFFDCPDSPIDLMYPSEFSRSKKIVPTKKKIGFLGLDKIGQGIIKNLYHSGHSIIIWNQIPNECERFTEKLKVQIVASPADVVEAADITFCFLTDLDTVENIVFEKSGVLEGFERCPRSGKGYVEMTSMEPKLSQRIGTEVKMKGGRYLEAKISESIVEANEGTLLILSSGDITLYNDCQSCLDAISKKHIFLSAEVGTAIKLNTVHNMLIGTVYAALAESLALVTEVGLKSEEFCDILKVGALSNKPLLQKATSMVKSNYTTDIALKQMQQDLNLGLSLGHEISQRTTMFSTANEVYKRCKSLRYGDQDVSAVFEGTRP